MNKKKIWIVNEYNGPSDIRTRQTVLSQYLEQKGYEVYLICGSTDNKGGENVIKDKVPFKFFESDGAKYYVVKTTNYHSNYRRVLVAIQFQYKLWRLRKKLPRPDVIVSDFAGLFGIVFLKWKRKYGTKIIYDILDLWPEGFVEMGYLKKNSIITKKLYQMEHKSYRDADGIIFSFQGGRDYIVDKGWSMEFGGDVDTQNIGYLNNGVDLETVDLQKKEYVFNDSDLNSDKFKVVYLGSISEFNGLDVLVKAAEILHERRIDNIQILVYGYGNQEERLKSIVKKKQLKNIKFKGQVDKKYAMNILSRGDLNLFTFKKTKLLKYGISPNKLFMYFASGKPVLSLIKPSYDLVENEHCGISVDNDPTGIVDSLVKFSKMGKKDYKMFCENSRKTALKYDYKELVNVLVNKIEA